MASNVDAVIAALKVALHEAERSHDAYWKVREANRWIGQLPGAWFGRWRNLKLKPIFDHNGEALRTNFIAQLRATLAYLEAHRDQINASRWFPPRDSFSGAGMQPVDADFEDVPTKLHTLPVPRRRTRTSK